MVSLACSNNNSSNSSNSNNSNLMFNDLILQKYFQPDKRIIYNILPLLDKKGYIATILPEEHTSNANIVITSSLKSNVWNGPIDNSAPDKESVIVDLTY